MVIKFPICTQMHRSSHFRVSSLWASRRALLRVGPNRGVAARSSVNRPSFLGESLRDVKKRARRGRCPALIRFAAAAVEFTSARSYRTLSRSLSKQYSNNRSLRRRQSGGHHTVCNLGVGRVSVSFVHFFCIPTFKFLCLCVCPETLCAC